MTVEKSRGVVCGEEILTESGMALFDAIPEGVILCQDMKILYMNLAAAKILGCEDDREAHFGERVLNYVWHEDHATLEDMYHTFHRSGHLVSRAEFRLASSGSDTRWALAKNSLVTYDDRAALVITISDITNTKRLETDNQRSEKLFHNIFHLAPEIMVLSSMPGDRIIDVNPAFLNLLGLRRDDTVGRSVKDLKIWADNTFIARFVEELKMTASMNDVPVALKIRGNIIRHFLLFAQKIEQGTEPMLLLIGRDVTDDITASRELQQSRNAAELANRAKSEFLANMSHELRTPLNAILGFAEILRDEMLGPIGTKRYCEYAGDIYDSGNHLLEIINDILDLSKVEAGQLEASREWIDPTACLEMCLTLVQQRATKAELALKSQLALGVLLEADERLLKQICLNLLSNSLKFTEPGGQIKLSLTKTANAGLCLTVSDTGIGMTADEIKIARRPFGQVRSDVVHAAEGSGLGLPLVSAFAEKMEATLTIDSAPGAGTRVNVLFPPFRVRAMEDEPEKASPDYI